MASTWLGRTKMQYMYTDHVVVGELGRKMKAAASKCSTDSQRQIFLTERQKSVSWGSLSQRSVDRWVTEAVTHHSAVSSTFCRMYTCSTSVDLFRAPNRNMTRGKYGTRCWIIIGNLLSKRKLRVCVYTSVYSLLASHSFSIITISTLIYSNTTKAILVWLGEARGLFSSQAKHNLFDPLSDYYMEGSRPSWRSDMQCENGVVCRWMFGTRSDLATLSSSIY